MTETKKNVKEEKVEEPKMADTIALAVENGLVAIDPTLEDGAILEMISQTEDTITAKLPDGEVIEIDKEAIVNPECNDADHISRAKVLDVIKTTFAKYETKVVLAMSEVRDIINTIIKAVKE
jgi:hypothetical protein